MRIEDATPGTKPRSAPSPALPPLIVKGKKLTVPVVQGGMGVGVSLHPLAGAVAREGGLGVVSSAAIDRVVSKRLGRKVGTYEAVREEIAASRSQGGLAGINIMVALQRDFADSVRAVDWVFLALGYTMASAYIGGEIRKPARSQLIGMVGAIGGSPTV